MQTKKRAKPVKFGKTTTKKTVDEAASKAAKAEIVKEEKIKETEEEKVTEKFVEEEKQPEVEEEKNESKVSDEDAKESKKEEESEDLEDEPSEINLSEEPDELEEKKVKKEEKAEADESDEEKEEEKEEQDEEDQKTEEVSETEEVVAEEKEEKKTSPYGSFTREEVLAPKRKSPWGFFILVVFVAFIVGLAVIIGGTYFFDVKDLSLPSMSQPTATPTVQPSPTPEEELDLSTHKIKVLNGSGISGEAAKLQTALEDAEFVVDSVGNAETSDYTKTVIAAKKSVNEEYLNALVKELKKSYQVNSVTESLDKSESVDVVITIGSDTAE